MVKGNDGGVKRRDGIDGRRSMRVIAFIPITLKIEQNPPVCGVTAVVNRHGALVLSPIEHEVGSIFDVRNELSSKAVRCRAVWVGDVGLSGTHKVGVEFVDDAPTFWGAVYEERLALGSGAGPPVAIPDQSPRQEHLATRPVGAKDQN